MPNGNRTIELLAAQLQRQDQMLELVLDTHIKFDLYAENGVAEYWIVFPGEQTVLAYALGANEEYELTGTYAEPGPMHSRRLPGLAIAWNDIFEELP